MRGRTVFYVAFATLMLLLLAYFLFFFLSGPQTVEGAQTEVLVEGLEIPWALDFLPDGTMIFTERLGRISIFDFENVASLLYLEVNHVGEGGLHGIAVHPDFEENGFIYVYYTHDDANRVSRFELLDTTLVNEEIILDGIPKGTFHNGGRLKFGPDSLLYITTGDAQNPELSQDTTSLAGKILRINPDGSVPEDNPFGNEVYSYGHRNSQGLAFHRETGEFFISDHGPNRRDRIDSLVIGENYGWPRPCDQLLEEHREPLRCYTGFTLAPSGIAIHEDKLYVAGLRGSQLRELTFWDAEVVDERIVLEGIGRIREVVSYENYLYIMTSNRDGRGVVRQGDDKIIRISLAS